MKGDFHRDPHRRKPTVVVRRQRLPLTPEQQEWARRHGRREPPEAGEAGGVEPGPRPDAPGGGAAFETEGRS